MNLFNSRRIGMLIFSMLIHLASGNAQTRTVGLMTNKSGVADGYILYAPKHDTMTYLINNDGKLIHEWVKCRYEPGQSVKLLPNGNLLRMCFYKNKVFGGGGDGGRFEEYDWDDNLVWYMNMSYGDKNNPSTAYMCHHDFAVLPNGNLLAIVWEYKTYEEAIAAGRDTEMFDPKTNAIWPDYVAEIEKLGSEGGKVVWEWHMWDHLIQDFDATKANYGVVGDHPELNDVNIWAESGSPPRANWNHINTIDYNAQLDQIMLGVRGNSEIFIIDHSTTTTEAAGHSGGRSGKGGDILYRWGNPQAYKAGMANNQILFQGHDCQWIHDGLNGAGNILMFNNGPEREFSTVVEWVLPTPDPTTGTYQLNSNKRYDPEQVIWEYNPPTAYQKSHFFSGEISGVQRLPNGNTLICSGTSGWLSEINNAQEVLWEYSPPNNGDGPMAWDEAIILDDRGHQMNAVFKIRKYPLDYPAFIGKDLTPKGPIETGFVSSIKKNEMNEGNIFKCYPNPTSDILNIEYAVKEPGRVQILVKNMIGQTVDIIEDNEKQKGSHKLQWDINGNSNIVNGFYLIELRQENEVLTAQLIVF